MNANREVEVTLAHQASQWLTVLRRSASREELVAFAEWLRTSPRHVRDFLIMVAIEKELHHADAQRKFGAHELSGTSAGNVSVLKPLAPSQRTSFEKRHGRWAAAAALVVIVAGALLWQLGYVKGSRDYTTQVGEQRAVELADGSIVHLNTQSHIKVRFAGNRRDIELLEGEVLFKVQRDPLRPFRVYSQDTVIQAVGTQFNVYSRPQGVTVSVLEGKVAVTRERAAAAPQIAELAAGEEARIASRGPIVKQRSQDPDNVVAWRQRRLVFEQEPLADMVREFNRYNSAPQIRLEGSAGPSRHYTGVFDADDPESLIQLLSAEPDLLVERAGETVVIRMTARPSEKRPNRD